MERTPTDYSPNAALRLYLENLRMTNPSPEVLEVIEQIESEIPADDAESDHRPSRLADASA